MTAVTRPGLEAPLPRAGRLPVLRSLLRGGLDASAWVRPAHLGISALAAVIYLFNLAISGYANTYYSAAALAASKSWSAWFFGSFDAANFITVDKPPLATMLMGLSVRLFGLSSWSILLPEGLAGVATVALLFVVVRHSFGPVAAAIAGLVMAFTPVAVLIFRYNNPDALLTLLLVAAAWAALQAIETGRLRWIVAAAIFVGFAFNTKYLQGFLVVPAFALTWLLAAPVGLRRRIAGLLVAALTLLISSGWWVVAVQLIPAAARPYIGGSTDNSAIPFALIGLAVGRTPNVSGTLTIAGSKLTAVAIMADLTALQSDDAHRDGQLVNGGIETATFPTATFTLSSPIDLGATPTDGHEIDTTASGQLTLHGVTKTVQVALRARLSGSVVEVVGSLPIVFADYQISKPNGFSVLSIADSGTMELQLFFTHA